MQSVLVLNHAKVCPTCSVPWRCSQPPDRETERSQHPRKPPARLLARVATLEHVSLRKSHQVGVSLVRQKPKTSEKAVVSGWDGQAQSTALEFKSQTPQTASSVGLSLLTLQVPASRLPPPASALKRQMLNWTTLCARHCSKQRRDFSHHTSWWCCYLPTVTREGSPVDSAEPGWLQSPGSHVWGSLGLVSGPTPGLPKVPTGDESRGAASRASGPPAPAPPTGSF